jgi:predicted HD phosphohydrolase
MTPEQGAIIAEAEASFDVPANQAAASLGLLESLRETDAFGHAVGLIDACEHSLQSATRALRDGADDATVAVLVLHDVFDAIADEDHGRLAAEFLRPYIDDDLYWILRHHVTFQKAYKVHLPDDERAAREAYRDHPLYDRTVQFCEQWDQAAFDPDYPSEPIERFAPLVERLFRGELRSTPFDWRTLDPAR